MKTLILLHEDAISDTHPVFEGLDDFKAIFVFDVDYFTSQPVSMKRLVFMMELIKDLNYPIDVFKGVTQSILKSLINEHSFTHIRIPESINPTIHEAYRFLKRYSQIPLEVTWVASKPFVAKTPIRESRRFFKYWNHIKKEALI